jgi:choline dehydrogenase-like flavoprotein
MVEFAPSESGTPYLIDPVHLASTWLMMHRLAANRSTVSASKEVVLSAGTIGTPQILMLSGIGNKTELSEVGINATVDLPDVGKHLKDHPIMSNYFTVNSTDTPDTIERNSTILNTFLDQWMTDRTGPLTDTPATAVGFLRLPDNASIFEQVQDPSAGT